jgi:hypothetical protein
MNGHTSEELRVIRSFEQVVSGSYDVFGWLGRDKNCSEPQCSLKVNELKEKSEVNLMNFLNNI